MKELTAKQKETLHFIYKFKRQKGFAPSMRDMAKEFGISSKAAFDRIKGLKKKGILATDDNISRSAIILDEEVIDEDLTVISIPILGTVHAGLPNLQEEIFDGEVCINTNLIPRKKRKQLFAMHVKGNSMIDAGIFDGDIAIIEKITTQEIKDGDIIVGSPNIVDDSSEITLKEIHFDNGGERFEFRPRNPELNSIFCTNPSIDGRLVLVIRQY